MTRSGTFASRHRRATTTTRGCSAATSTASSSASTRPTEDDYGKNVTLQIDGQPVTVPLAEPLKDAQGNIVLDIDGRTTPRYTTIYDAAVRLYVKQPGDEAQIPIPVLCHQPHMTPVAVCRLCVVQVYGQKRGKRRGRAEAAAGVPAPGEGRDGSLHDERRRPRRRARARSAVKVMTELLTADHLKPAPRAGARRVQRAASAWPTGAASTVLAVRRRR